MKRPLAIVLALVTGWAGLQIAVRLVPGWRGVAGSLLRPFGVPVAYFHSLARDNTSAAGAAELRRLRRENERLRLELLRLRENERRNDELRSLLSVAPSSEWQAVAAPVTARDPLTWDLQFHIGRGSAEGIRRGAAVLHRDGVIGRVASVSAHSAIVRTLRDATCGLSVELGTEPRAGVCRGSGGSPSTILVDYLPTDAVIRPGEEVVTSGLSEWIPGGLPVGHVVPWDDETMIREVPGAHAQALIRVSPPETHILYVWVISFKP